MIYLCVCGCGQEAVHEHHAIYVQELRRIAKTNGVPWSTLIRDRRNLVAVALSCHAEHHNRQRPLPLTCLPTAVLSFARSVLGPGPAYEYLLRRYAGEDPRLDELLAEWERAA